MKSTTRSHQDTARRMEREVESRRLRALRTAIFALAALLLALAPAAGRAEDKIPLTSGTAVMFATVEQGRAILGAKDDYILAMSPFDRQLRLETDKPVSEAEILKFAASCVIPWGTAEKNRTLAALMTIAPRLARFKLDLPPTILLVETNGHEEDRSASTRANAIMLPRNFFWDGTNLEQLVTHELFHVMTRHNPKLRQALYGCIGFTPCGEIELPADLKARKISNPDEVKNDFCISVQCKGRPCDVMPVLFSDSARYNADKGGGIFANMVVRLLAIEKKDGQWRAQIKDGKPQLLEFNEVSGLYEKVGRNTRYIIGPEEIMADEFMMLVAGQQNLPSPKVIEALRGVLEKAGVEGKILNAKGKMQKAK